MDVQKIEQILLSKSVTNIQKTILMTIYRTQSIGEKPTVRKLASYLNTGFAQLSLTISEIENRGAIKKYGTGGRGGLEYVIQWEAL